MSELSPLTCDRLGILLVGLLGACASPRSNQLVARAIEPEHRCKADTLRRDSVRQASDSVLASRFAPVLWFAPGELDFPTVPYFTAWDTIDQDGDLLLDLADTGETGEVAMLTGRESPAEHSWDDLFRHYGRALHGDQEGTMQLNLQRSAVFYRVCDLTSEDKRELFRVLRLDEQAWDRLQMDFPFPQATEFTVVQYFFYYVRDAGLQGHPHDVEKVFVFLPRDTADARKLRIVVGAGHTPRVPNNVLIRFAPREGLTEFPDTGDALNVLVELGGHSSAPDVPPYGQLAAGLDANWQAYDLWGTRDVQAAAGTSFVGAYRREMTFPRDSAQRNVVQLRADRGQESALRVEAQRKQFSTPEHAPISSYRLVPVSVYRRMWEALDRWDGASPHDHVVPLVTDFQRALGRGKLSFDRLDSTTQVTALRTMKDHWDRPQLWTGRDSEHACAPRRAVPRHTRVRSPLPPWWERAGPSGRFGRRCYAAGTKHRIWESEAYRNDPVDIFKAHLFRPNLGALRGRREPFRLVTWGWTYDGLRASEPYLGLVLPAFRSYEVPFRLPGFLEAQAGLYTRDPLHPRRARKSFSGSLVWEHHRNAWVSWYQRLSWIPRRAEVVGTSSDVSVATGVSLLPVIQTHSGPCDLVNALRVRVGLRIHLNRWDDAFNRVAWEAQVSFRQ